MMRRRCVSCGTDHAPDGWRALEHLSTQVISGEAGEREIRLDWRRCICGNALPVDLADPAMVEFIDKAVEKMK
jgi:hypothetical protein